MKLMIQIIHSNLNKEYNLMSVAETLKKPAPRFHWKCKHTWRRSAKNTAWCLLGCSIGDFGTILYFQLTGIPWPTLYIMILAIINGRQYYIFLIYNNYMATALESLREAL